MSPARDPGSFRRVIYLSASSGKPADETSLLFSPPHQFSFSFHFPFPLEEVWPFSLFNCSSRWIHRSFSSAIQTPNPLPRTSPHLHPYVLGVPPSVHQNSPHSPQTRLEDLLVLLFSSGTTESQSCSGAAHRLRKEMALMLDVDS